MFVLRFATPIAFLLIAVSAKPRDFFEEIRSQQNYGKKNAIDLTSEVGDISEGKSNGGFETLEPTVKRIHDKIGLLKEIPDHFSKGQVGKAFNNFGKAVSGVGEAIESDASVAGFVSHHILDNVEKAFQKIKLPGYGKLIKVGILAFSESFNERFEKLVSTGFQFLSDQLSYKDYRHMSDTLIRFQKDYELLSVCVFVKVEKIMLDNFPEE